MIHIETDERKLAQFIAQKMADGGKVTGVCMTGPRVERESGGAGEGVLIDRGCWKWVNSFADWRVIFKGIVRPVE